MFRNEIMDQQTPEQNSAPVDPLVDLVSKHLLDANSGFETQHELVHGVVAEYIFELMQMGNIPVTHLDALEVDLSEEVLEIYRKITYGSLSLLEFRTRRVTTQKNSGDSDGESNSESNSESN